MSRLTVAGATLLLGGASVIVGGLMESGQGPAFADSSPVELFCPGTPVGNLVANNAVISGSLSVGAPSSGQQFSLDGFQAQIPLSSDVVNDAQAIGNTSLSGTTQSTIEVSGATPASMPTGPMTFDAPIPNPVPSSGVTISVPTSAQAFGPFTASSQNITVALSQEISLVFDDAGNNIDLTCSWYPNDSIPQSGLTQQTPPGLPITPVVAFAGSGGGAPPAVSATGPYELYCPKTPVGNIALNDVVTSGTVEPTSLSAGDQFNLSGYQTQIPIPAGIASGLAGFGNTQLQGYSATTIDAFGASPSELSTGLEAFDVSLPNPIPPTGVTLDVPSTAGTVGPFTANGGAITVAGEQTTLMVAALSSHIVNLGCQAYPNDSVTPSGVVESAPLGSPILPVITTASASGTSPTTTTTTVPYNPSNPTPITGPYELFCPDTPLGNLVLNDTVTTASISPSDPSVGGAFDITGYQTQITVPQPILQLFAGVGVNTVSGMMEADVTASGALPENGGVIGVVSTPPSPVVTVPPYSVATGSSASSSSSGGAVGSGSSGAYSPPVILPGGVVPPGQVVPPPIIPPFPVPGMVTFSESIPTPIPSAGVTFDVPSPPADLGMDFTALGGPIVVEQQALYLELQAAGTADYQAFCQAYPNDTEPEGVTTTPPPLPGSPVQIASGNATLSPPSPPYYTGAHEEFCSGTIGNVVMNGVTTAASLSPSDPTEGQQFELTGYQSTSTIPPDVAQEAAAVGATAITGTSTGSLSAVGASPSTLSTGAMSLDIPIPNPIPPSGLTEVVPSSPATLGPFTATGGTVTILASPVSTLSVNVGGISVTMECIAYPNDSQPGGFGALPPNGSPIWPVVATNDPTVVTTPPVPTAPTSSPDPTVSNSDPAGQTSAAGNSQPGSNGGSGTISASGSSSNESGQSGSAPSSSGSGASDPSAVSASSGSLAFTGPGSILGWLALSGSVLALLGIGVLVLVDAPRRAARRLAAFFNSTGQPGRDQTSKRPRAH